MICRVSQSPDYTPGASELAPSDKDKSNSKPGKEEPDIEKNKAKQETEAAGGNKDSDAILVADSASEDGLEVQVGMI